MEDQERNLPNEKNKSKDEEVDKSAEESITNGKKAIEIQDKVTDLSEAEKNKDAEKWRNEG